MGTRTPDLLHAIRRRRMGACETTPPTTQPGNRSPERPSPPPDHQPPLTSIQLIRPRRCAAAGAPAGPRPRGSHINAATGERPTQKNNPQPVTTPRSPGQINLPQDREGPHGCTSMLYQPACPARLPNERLTSQNFQELCCGVPRGDQHPIVLHQPSKYPNSPGLGHEHSPSPHSRRPEICLQDHEVPLE